MTTHHMATPTKDIALQSTLLHLGLTRIEAAVYLALLEHGAQQAGSITKLTGVHRRTIYDAIARLVEKGLIAYIKTNHTRVYQATHPERLLELVKEQEQHVQSKMHDLEALYANQPARHETVFYRGKKGLKALFDDQLAHAGTELLYLGATPAAVETLQYYFPQFDRQRQQRNIKVKLLFDQRAQGKGYIRKIPRAEARSITTDNPTDVVTCIYGDSVAIITFSEKPFGILIREAAVATQQRNWFSLLWKRAKKL
jgi:sugar-specific transcriptional regulator TrmB